MVSTLEKILQSKQFVFLGVFAFVWALISISIAISISPWFNWYNNALSDLGVYETGFLAALIFNQGLIVGGIFCVGFCFGLWYNLGKSTIEKIGIIIFALGGISLTLIGVFPETAPEGVHFAVSVGFFVALPLAMWTLAVKWIQKNETRLLALLSIIIPFIVIGLWIQPWVGVAIPEIVSSILTIIWALSLAYYVRCTGVFG